SRSKWRVATRRRASTPEPTRLEIAQTVRALCCNVQPNATVRDLLCPEFAVAIHAKRERFALGLERDRASAYRCGPAGQQHTRPPALDAQIEPKAFAAERHESHRFLRHEPPERQIEYGVIRDLHQQPPGHERAEGAARLLEHPFGNRVDAGQ